MIREDLQKILQAKKWEQPRLLSEYVASMPESPVEAQNEPDNTRSSAQHRALFLWYGQIADICQNLGVTWDRLIKHTTQIKVTKENLHEAGKQLQKVLWGKYTTKALEKDQIDTLTMHFIDWMSKEGIECPPFPSNVQPDYPRDYKEPLI